MIDDVLIVGAGPAGTVAAAVLARAGARVCVIDRARFPRPKLCGDTINPGTLRLLQRHGAAAQVEARGVPLAGMRVSGPGVTVDGRYPRGLHGVAIGREEFDALLLDIAIEAGAVLREETTARAPLLDDPGSGPVVRGVRCTANDGTIREIRARVTIAADGRRSVLAFALGLARHPRTPRRWAVGVRATGVTGLSSRGEMHVRRGHYIGIAPLPGGVANLCLVRPLDDRGTLRDPAAALREALAHDPMLSARCGAARFCGAPVVLGPLGVERTSAPIPGGLLLAGDAAGFVDPMTGDGLRFAIRGGELAAAAALRALEHGWAGVHADLDDRRRRDFSSKQRFNRALRALVGSDAGVRAATLGGRLAPAVVRMLIRRASDCGLAVAG
jgi:geranylgeranyl reductase family protein